MLVGPEFPTSSVLPSSENRRSAIPLNGMETASSGAVMFQSLISPPSVAEATDLTIRRESDGPHDIAMHVLSQPLACLKIQNHGASVPVPRHEPFPVWCKGQSPRHYSVPNA